MHNYEISTNYLLYILAPRTFVNYSHAQDSRGISQSLLQQYYKSQSKTNDGEDRNNIPNYDPTVKTYPAIGPPHISPPLAVPLPFRLGESERKNTVQKSRKKKTEKLTEYQKAQLWRYKPIKGTDKHLKEIFIGKCWSYQRKFRFQEAIDCARLWEAFVVGFAYKEPCDVALEDYKEFFSMIHEDPLVNTVRD